MGKYGLDADGARSAGEKTFVGHVEVGGDYHQACHYPGYGVDYEEDLEIMVVGVDGIDPCEAQHTCPEHGQKHRCE